MLILFDAIGNQALHVALLLVLVLIIVVAMLIILVLSGVVDKG